jgi:tetratricopeptide (TPR) repeat protein
LWVQIMSHMKSRKPFPRWIWLLAGSIPLVILLFFLSRQYTPEALHKLALSSELQDGLKAEKKRQYLTAERELKAYTAKAPGNEEAEGRLMIAAFYNQDFETFSVQFTKLKDKEMKDKELFAELNGIMTKAAFYYPSDSIKDFSSRYPVLTAIPDSAWENYFNRNPADVDAKEIYAEELYKEKRYSRCDSIIEDILSSHDDYIPALATGASVRRKEEDYDKALEYNKRILQINPELPDGLASEVLTLLLLKQDADALDVALKAYALDERNAYVKSSLILAYHYNDRKADRDALIQKASKEAADSGDQKMVQYALDVMAKKEKFRDY